MVLNLFKATTNKTKKTQKTSYSCGNKYVTEAKTKKNGGISLTTKSIKKKSK